jgi:catechol 2,3-dioxygenase
MDRGSTHRTHPETRIGHIHLKVSDLAGGYHHHIGLNTWDSQGAAPPYHTGLYHVAFLYPDRPALAQALRAVLAAGVALDGAADHGVSEALYFRDPDGNGIEIYRDRAPEDWPRAPDGSLAMNNQRLDVAALLAEA